MAVKSTNSYQEILTKLLQDVAAAQTLPDSNVDFLRTVQDMLIEEAQAPLRAQAQQASAAAPPSAAGQMPAGPGGAGPLPQGPPPGEGVGTMMTQLLGQPTPPAPRGPAAAELDRIMA